MCAERDWSGKRVIGSGAVSGREKIGWSGSERLQSGERSGERTKLAAQISLKGDAMLAYSNFVSLVCPLSKINYQPEF